MPVDDGVAERGKGVRKPLREQLFASTNDQPDAVTASEGCLPSDPGGSVHH
jgi:hypothetical protein